MQWDYRIGLKRLKLAQRIQSLCSSDAHLVSTYKSDLTCLCKLGIPSWNLVIFLANRRMTCTLRRTTIRTMAKEEFKTKKGEIRKRIAISFGKTNYVRVSVTCLVQSHKSHCRWEVFQESFLHKYFLSNHKALEQPFFVLFPPHKQ